jgi:hypothetical protein
MHARSGFARLLPLLAFTGLTAGTLALLASAGPVQAPMTVVMGRPFAVEPSNVGQDGGCSDVPAPVPSHGIRDARGRLWELGDIPGREVKGLKLAGAEWSGMILRGETFTAWDFCNADLRNADLSNSCLWECDFSGAELTGTNLSEVSYDIFTRWPAGFDPQAHGARLGR